MARGVSAAAIQKFASLVHELPDASRNVAIAAFAQAAVSQADRSKCSDPASILMLGRALEALDVQLASLHLLGDPKVPPAFELNPTICTLDARHMHCRCSEVHIS